MAIADGGQTLVSWEVRGATGRIVDNLDDAGGPTDGDGFWVFPLWYFADFGRTYDRLTQDERAALGDHWESLKAFVQEFVQTLARPARPPATMRYNETTLCNPHLEPFVDILRN